MSKVKTISRYVLGIMLVVFGANIFFNFIPMPPMAPEGADFMQALIKTGYMMPLVGAIEIITGLLLLMKKYVPLALLMILPVMLNAFLLHLFLDVQGVGGSLLGMILIIYLMIANKDAYKSVLQP